MAQPISIFFVNNHGKGFADSIDIQEGTSVRELMESRMPGHSPSNFNVKVNNTQVDADYVLQDNDRVVVSMTKIEGACA